MPQTKILRNEKPLGYAANLNRILAATSAYVLLMNTDMYFDPADQCLAKMVAFMDERPRSGISICQIYRPDGSYGHPARRFPTLRTIARAAWDFIESSNGPYANTSTKTVRSATAIRAIG